VNELAIGLLGALLATNQPQAVSNVIQQQAGVAVDIAATPAEKELREVMLADDAAQDDVNGWLREYDSQSDTNKTAAASAALNARIKARFDKVRGAYENFLQRHPESAHGFLAYGSFLNDTGDEEGAHLQYENSKQLDPKNPAVWNNLANYYGEHSPVTKAFEYYAQAIRLKPDEPVYYENFATTVYLFRKDAKEFYHLDEQQVFDKTLGLYQQAMRLAPDSFVLATDYAESYYGIRPLRTNDALVAWTNAMTIAHTDAERQGVEIHLARVKFAAGFFGQAGNHLAAVTNAAYLGLKKQLCRSLADHEHPDTNSEAAVEDRLLKAVPQLAPAGAADATNISDLSSNLLAVPPPVRGKTP
jgi:cytochrome c-type biogenesis protein CcmH/NrfG